MKKAFILLSIVLALAITSLAQTSPHFPLKLSDNHRYFVDQDNRPFLYHADTGWDIFTKLTTKEALEYMSFRKSQGFNTLQVQIVMSPDQVDKYGHRPSCW